MMDLAEKEKIYDSAWAKEERKRLESRQIPSHVLGINQAAFEKMGFLDSSCTWQEFTQGDYVIVSASTYGFGGYAEPGTGSPLSWEDRRESSRFWEWGPCLMIWSILSGRVRIMIFLITFRKRLIFRWEEIRGQ